MIFGGRILLSGTLAAVALPALALEEITVTAERRPRTEASLPAAVGVIDSERNEVIGARHPGELVGQVAGVWVSRGSGQEHLTAIRSPVLTGAGACGAFLYLEDGIPLRPAGFCNVNGLFEVNLEQARAIEIWRGPAPTLYGSNGLHGLINVVSAKPAAGWQSSVEAWEDDYYRATLGVGAADGKSGLNGVFARDAGLRANSGFDQFKTNAFWQPAIAHGTLEINFAGSYLNQDTAGFIRGEDAYRDPRLSLTNPNPEAYRDAYAVRLYGRYETDIGDWQLDLRPFLRHSDMEFLQHFLPGQPVEKNGQTSAGLSLFVTSDRLTGFTGGVDVEWVNGFLEEFQDAPITTGSAFLVETRPAGLHYDYTVTGWLLAPHVGYKKNVTDKWLLELAARLEWLSYDYDNKTLTGNTRPDGTSCGFGGCLFNRPADRTDDFVNFAPRVSISRPVADQLLAYIAYGRGFRSPQATELYRLQRQQSVADLDSEKLDSVEIGVKGDWPKASLRAAAYRAQKRNFIFRDADGFNVSDGRTRHIGVELSAGLRPHPQLSAQLALTTARHTYRFNQASAGIANGLDVDTAPRLLGEVSLSYRPTQHLRTNLRVYHQGEYFLEPANTRLYPGHTVVDLRIGLERGQWDLQLAVDNVFDRRFADRADFAFGSFRYFPAPGRRVGLRFTFKDNAASLR